MKVSYVTMRFPSTTETFATNDVRTLRDRGVDVRVHALKAAHPLADELVEQRDLNGIPFTHGGMSGATRGLRAAVRRPGLLLELLRIAMSDTWRRPEQLVKSLALAPRALDVFAEIESDLPDVVHIYWGHYPSLVGALVQRRLPGVVTSISLAAYDLELKYGVTGRVAADADMVRTLGEVNVSDIHEAFGIPEDEIHVIYDGVDLSRFPASETRLAKVPGRIVTAGRLIPSKGMDDVLRAFARVIEAVPHASLVVLGDGSDRERLEGMASHLGIDGATTFAGYVPHDRVFEEMARAEVFLFMSTKSSERLPNVVKEAMGLRCVCVATDTPGIDELLVDGDSGWVVPRGDVETAADRVIATLSTIHAGEPAPMGVRAYERLTQRFGLVMNVDRYISAWNRLVSGRAASDGAA